MGKLEGKKSLERSKRIWEDNIKIGLREVRCGGIDWIDLAQDWSRWRVFVNSVMNIWIL